MNPRVLLFTMALTLASALLFGIVPALQNTRSAASANPLADGSRSVTAGRSLLRDPESRRPS